MNPSIVMTAFGTTTKALETYSFIDEICKRRFPDHEILWAYSSRIIKDRMKKRQNIEIKHPHQVLSELKKKGHSWAVVQSMHLTCGHEFYRLTEEVRECEIRTSVGLPLLCYPEDYQSVAQVFSPVFSDIENEAVILTGHGSDHPARSSYLALQYIFREKFGPEIYVGLVEDGYPSREMIIEDVKKSGFKSVRLIPFMLVAGVHFQEDLMGEEDSWKKAFEKKGISVSAETGGIGLIPDIVEIFCKHIQDALDVIPGDL